MIKMFIITLIYFSKSAVYVYLHNGYDWLIMLLNLNDSIHWGGGGGIKVQYTGIVMRIIAASSKS